jgi:beta-glucanase (GH16 family)
MIPQKHLLAIAGFAALFLLGTHAAPAQMQNVPQRIVTPLGKTMTLKFHDEFDPVTDKDGKPYIDRTKWETNFWQGRNERTLYFNKEAQFYLDKDYGLGDIKPAQRVNPFSFEKPGILTISATKVPETLWQHFRMTKERCFASGLLSSDKTFTFKYGYVEGRFKLPGDRGAWPCLWMLGNDPSRGTPVEAHQWPPEIDVVEYMGHWKTKFDGAVLARKEDHSDWRLRYFQTGFDLTKDFHTWAVEWNEEEIALIFDGKIWTRGKTPESLKRPMYLLINLAVGGKWYSSEMTNAKTPAAAWEVDETTMPWKMECDYVRVYQP